jgi:hypothetical protein
MHERDISRLLAEREGGQCEVRTPAGSIDVLTTTYVYEVKVARDWKAALGQVLAYAQAFPTHKPRLYLYGDTGGMTKKAIEEHCRAAGVGVVWHREEDAPPRSVQPPAVRPDAMKLTLTAVDATYGIRTQSVFNLPVPTAPIALASLEAYADQALATFDALLDNALTLRLVTTVQGEQTVVERTRAMVHGDPVSYQLRLTIRTARPRMNIAASLPGARRHLFSLPHASSSGTLQKLNHARRDLPVLHQLTALITHPDFPWMSIHGERALGIETALYRKYGIVRSKKGFRIGKG